MCWSALRKRAQENGMSMFASGPLHVVTMQEAEGLCGKKNLCL